MKWHPGFKKNKNLRNLFIVAVRFFVMGKILKFMMTHDKRAYTIDVFTDCYSWDKKGCELNFVEILDIFNKIIGEILINNSLIITDLN